MFANGIDRLLCVVNNFGMPAKRKRLSTTGAAMPCSVELTDELAEFVYREKIKGRYRDETELVRAILREWIKTLSPMDWPEVVELIKAEEAKPRRPKRKRSTEQSGKSPPSAIPGD